nr:lyase family protein [Streptomyces varsoviensis]
MNSADDAPGAAYGDSGLLAPAWAGSAAEAATGDAAYLTALLDAEAALTRAQAALGQAPRSAADAATAAARADAFDVRDLALRARDGGNPVIPLAAVLTAAVARTDPAAAAYVHRGATSQDILDTALMLVAARTLPTITADLARAAEALAALAAAHRATPMPGRTLTQHAVPTTFGLKAAGWRALLLDAHDRLTALHPTLPAQLAGATGTLAAFTAYSSAGLAAAPDADPAAARETDPTDAPDGPGTAVTGVGDTGSAPSAAGPSGAAGRAAVPRGDGPGGAPAAAGPADAPDGPGTAVTGVGDTGSAPSANGPSGAAGRAPVPMADGSGDASAAAGPGDGPDGPGTAVRGDGSGGPAAAAPAARAGAPGAEASELGVTARPASGPAALAGVPASGAPAPGGGQPPGDGALGLVGRFAAEVGLAEPGLPWHTLRTPVADLAAALAFCSGALGKLAADVLVLSRTEIGEAAEGEGGGSSAMPHKRNPVRATLIAAAARQAPALAAVLVQSLAAEDERPAGAWHAEWQTLRELLRLAGGAAHQAAELAEGLKVFPQRMRENLDTTGGLMTSERVVAALSPVLGRARAKELLTAAARRAVAERVPLADALVAEEPGLSEKVSEDRLRRLTDPAGYLGRAPELTDRALRRRPRTDI